MFCHCHRCSIPTVVANFWIHQRWTYFEAGGGPSKGWQPFVVVRTRWLVGHTKVRFDDCWRSLQHTSTSSDESHETISSIVTWDMHSTAFILYPASFAITKQSPPKGSGSLDAQSDWNLLNNFPLLYHWPSSSDFLTSVHNSDIFCNKAIESLSR